MKQPAATCLFLILFCLASSAQERLAGLQINRAVAEAHKAELGKLKSIQSGVPDTLELPFFDDFAEPSVLPNSHRWSDSYVFINNGFPVNPVSLGAATFDALDASGNIYPNASFSPFSADVLTSQYINLDYPADSNIYLSFFYQPQGNGDAPEAQDSLILEFYAAAQNKWIKAWAAQGDTLIPFKQVILPVSDTTYLKTGFRFRFRNLASLVNDAFRPGRINDDDHWNIDYVYLNKGRSATDTAINDIAITAPLPSPMYTYESIPWSQYTTAMFSVMKPFIPISYRNYSSLEKGIFRNFSVSGQYAAYTYKFPVPGGVDGLNILPFSLQVYEPQIESFPSDSNDSALFKFTYFLSIDTVSSRKPYRWNDTVVRYQEFNNYFAYDDGSAENGYGIDGEGTTDAELAYQFTAYTPDTLRAVLMYFNDVFDHANVKNFYLTVWKDQDNEPGDILFSKADETFKPTFDSRNHFIRYSLDEPVFVSGKFYVGWIQTSETFLNVGFDKNNNNSDKAFYNISGTWLQSGQKGSLMIRPVLGKPLSTGVTTDEAGQETVRLYPNPASDYLRLEYPQELNARKGSVLLYDASGRQLIRFDYLPETMDISGFKPGLYLLSIKPFAGFPLMKKFMIVR